MVIGREERKLNKKQQVVFPSRFKETFGNRLIITKGVERNLYVVPRGNIDTLLANGDKTLFVRRNVRQIQRFFLGNATEVELDSSARFVIPEYLRKYAGLVNDIVFAGIKNYIEVWDKEAWDNQQAFLELTAERIVEDIGKTGGKRQ